MNEKIKLSKIHDCSKCHNKLVVIRLDEIGLIDKHKAFEIIEKVFSKLKEEL